MVAEAFRLVLFPAMMAFAASSDLLTMTISNRVTLIVAAGFVVLALATGMGMVEFLWHLGAGALDHLAVPQMDAIEIANGDDRAAIGGTDIVMAEDAHRRPDPCPWKSAATISRRVIPG